MIRRTHHRAGFTLVEMLVALGLALVLLALAIGVSQSSAFDSYKIVGSADRVSQWMLVAKNKALRDKTARGIRFYVNAGTGFCTEMAYIEQPDPWLPPVKAPTLPNPRLIIHYPATVTPTSAAIINGSRAVYIAGLTTAEANDLITILQSGDYLNIPELSATLRLTAAPSILGTPANFPGNANIQLNVSTNSFPDLGAAYSRDPGTSTNTLATGEPSGVPPNNGTFSTTSFSVIRQPRPLLGEPNLLLPETMIVDFDVTQKQHPLTKSGSPAVYPTQFDVLFSPSGEVIDATDTLYAFLLRDVNLGAAPIDLNTQTSVDPAGQMIMVCVYTRTGAIATQPPAPPGTSGGPYQFAKDGINSGL